jgi:hypothetical protein
LLLCCCRLLLGSSSLLLSGGRLGCGRAAYHNGGPAPRASPDTKDRMCFGNQLFNDKRSITVEQRRYSPFEQKRYISHEHQ